MVVLHSLASAVLMMNSLAGGNARDLAREKAAKKKAAPKGNKEELSAAKRAERYVRRSWRAVARGAD